MGNSNNTNEPPYKADASKSPDAKTAAKLQIISSGNSNPRLTLAELEYPSYLVNGNFEIEWCNQAAEKAFLGKGRALGTEIGERALFSSFFSAGQLHDAMGTDAVLRMHVAVAKQRMPKAALLAANSGIEADRSAEIARIYDQVEPIRTREIISTEVDLGASRGNELWFNLIACFFREGVLFSYTPAEDTSSALVSLLSRRDMVIRDILKTRKPYLTKLAVIVAELESSVKICAELPPEEYFELINSIWTILAVRLRKYFATHGKHVSDGAVYYFLPQPDSNYILNAVQCSQDMQEAVKEISRDWKARKNWLNDLKIKIGLEEGEEWFGVYQTPSHLEFTVLGDTINRTSRLSHFAAGGTSWATKSLLTRLSSADRSRIRYGVRYPRGVGEEVLVPSSYARIGDLIDLLDPTNHRLNDISGLTVTEILDVARSAKS